MNYQNDIFNGAAIYNMLFFNVKTVLEYPTLDLLQTHKPEMYKNWILLMGDKFNNLNLSMEQLYSEYGILYPEYTKIVCITYGKVFLNETEGKMDRTFKKITGLKESIILETFFDELNGIDTGTTLCSFNGNKDIQLLVKRFIYLRSELSLIKKIPSLIKETLNGKPWENNIVDVNSIWKFNTYESNLPTFSIITDFLQLKRNVEMLSDNDLSKYYWNNIDEHQDETMKFIELQSINNTNMMIQLLNELRAF
jgi:hypothetical protein